MGLLPRLKDSAPDYRKIHPLPEHDLEKGDSEKLDTGPGRGTSHERKDRPVVITWSMRAAVIVALTVLTSSQGIFIAFSKKAGQYDYSVTTANLMVELTKCGISIVTLFRVWQVEGVTEDNRLLTSWGEILLYPVPAFLYLVKNMLQYYIFIYVDPPSYQVLKNLNVITTGILFSIFLRKRLSSVQWSALLLLAIGCTTAQLTSTADSVFETSLPGLLMAVLMAVLSGAAGVYTELIIKRRIQRSIHVQNFYLYAFGIVFNGLVISLYDSASVRGKGFFHGYTGFTVVMIVNHALSGIAVSLVMKFADNIVKVYSTSVAMLLTTLLSIPLFGFKLTVPFVLGSAVVTIATFLHSQNPHRGELARTLSPMSPPRLAKLIKA